ncbi:MAG: photosynthetic reaction center cytochrome c subunit [Chromatiaceae bacterium]|nr:photosynthetic reaction center cytochrome c subunit [Chromatiaceae bacterium]
MRRIALSLPLDPRAQRARQVGLIAALADSTFGEDRLAQHETHRAHDGYIRPMPVVVLGLTASLVLIAGCEQSESVQTGLRGTSMIQLYKPTQLAKLQEINRIPDPEPSDPYDPSFPMATEVHQNVQVLTDLNALEFARLMNAISTWIAPEQGCAYCHNPADLASDEKFTKIVSREMLKMTRSINTNWKSHVVETGVTCWTCHRGQPIPSDIWFKAPEPETPSAAISGWKGGQNVSGVSTSGYSSLPFDPLTPFLDEANQIAVQGTEVLPYGNRKSIKQTEWTYSLMMYMSNSLGVNCTYCHQTRAMGEWDQSTPQRVTAWHGIRMVRDLNQSFLNPLKPLYPEDRLGPEGDAPKAACATCHKGTYKPLFGQTMLNDYPSMAGVLPGRLDPEAEAAAIQSLSQVSPMILAQASTPALAEQTLESAAEPLTAAATEPAADSTTAQAPESVPIDEPPIDEPATAQATESDAGAATAQVSESASESASAQAIESAAESATALAPQRVAEPATDLEMAASDSQRTSDADRAALAAATAAVAAANARLDQERTALQQQLEVVREQRRQAQAIAESRIDAKQHRAKLDAAETRIRAARAKLEQQRHALQQQLALVRNQRDMAHAQAEGRIQELHALHEKALAEQGQQVTALETRLEQNLVALNQQLEVVRSQRDDATETATARVDEITDEHEDILSAKRQRIAALQARLDQNRHALEQQLAVVRTQRDAAVAQAEQQIAALMNENEDLLELKQQRLGAMQARLDQNRHALDQQLEVARSRGAEQDASARLIELEEAYEKQLAELKQQIEQAEQRVADAHDPLQRQLAIALEERDALVLDTEAKIGELNEALAAERASLAQMRDQQEAEVAALRQQLTQADDELEQLRSQLAQETTDHAEALVEAQGSVTRIRLQPQDAEEIGGRLTDDGILVNLGSDELRFASGSATLPTQQLPTLDRTAALLAARPELSARIEGHTDSVGSAAINQALSQQRAEAVRQALIERGIDPQRLAARGAGPDQPIADNTTPEGRRQNRRVEIFVTAESDPSTADDSSDSG